MLITTTGAPESTFAPGQLQDMTLNDRLHHVTYGTFAFCGFDVYPTFYINNPISLGEDGRK